MLDETLDEEIENGINAFAIEYDKDGDFKFPKRIMGTYELKRESSFLAEIGEIGRYKNNGSPETKEIGLDIWVECSGGYNGGKGDWVVYGGKFSPVEFKLYGMNNYEYAVLRIKKVVN